MKRISQTIFEWDKICLILNIDFRNSYSLNQNYIKLKPIEN